MILSRAVSVTGGDTPASMSRARREWEGRSRDSGKEPLLSFCYFKQQRNRGNSWRELWGPGIFLCF